MEGPFPKFNIVKTGEIPENIRRLQEKLGFQPGEPLTLHNFRRLCYVKYQDEIEVGSIKKPNINFSVHPQVKDMGKQEYNNLHKNFIGHSKIKKVVKPENTNENAKEKALKMWGAPKDLKASTNKIGKKENVICTKDVQREKHCKNFIVHSKINKVVKSENRNENAKENALKMWGAPKDMNVSTNKIRNKENVICTKDVERERHCKNILEHRFIKKNDKPENQKIENPEYAKLSAKEKALTLWGSPKDLNASTNKIKNKQNVICTIDVERERQCRKRKSSAVIVPPKRTKSSIAT